MAVPLLATSRDPLDWEDASPEDFEALVGLRVALPVAGQQELFGSIVRYDEGCRKHLVKPDYQEEEEKWHDLSTASWRVRAPGEDRPPEPKPPPPPPPPPRMMPPPRTMHQPRIMPQPTKGKKRPRHEPVGELPDRLEKILTSSDISVQRGQCFLTTSRRMLGVLFPDVNSFELPTDVHITETETNSTLQPTLREYSTGYFLCGNGWRELISQMRLTIGDTITIRRSGQRCLLAVCRRVKISKVRQGKDQQAAPAPKPASVSSKPALSLTCPTCLKVFRSIPSLRSHKGWCEAQARQRANTGMDARAPPTATEPEPIERGTVFVNPHWGRCCVCGGQGGLVCCDKCPTRFHPNCVGLEMSAQCWHCPHCSGEGKLSQYGPQDDIRADHGKLPRDDQLHGLYSVARLVC